LGSQLEHSFSQADQHRKTPFWKVKPIKPPLTVSLSFGRDNVLISIHDPTRVVFHVNVGHKIRHTNGRPPTNKMVVYAGSLPEDSSAVVRLKSERHISKHESWLVLRCGSRVPEAEGRKKDASRGPVVQ